MKHVTDEQLVLQHYREGDDWQDVQEHLGSCGACRARHEELVRLLAAVHPAPVPERDTGYGRRVWQRVRPRLEERPRFSWRWLLEPFQLPAVPRWAFAPAGALLLLGAFWVGGLSWRAPSVDVPQLRASLEQSLKAELQREFDTRLQGVLAQVRSEVAKSPAGQSASSPVAPSAASLSRSRDLSVSQKEFQKLWAEFLETYAGSRAEDRREIVALRRDLETLVIEADSRLERARAQIGHLAALTRPAAATTRPSVPQ